MKIEDTGGNITYWIPNCGCGLTGGCEKCQPITIFKYPTKVVTPQSFPLPQSNLRDNSQIHERLQEIHRKSHEKYGEAWRKLAEV
jgi:hypothetical protein